MIKYIFLGLAVCVLLACKKEVKFEEKLQKSVAQNNQTNNFNSPYYANSFAYNTSKELNPYEVNMKTFQIDKDTYSMEINMKLFQGSFFVSPKSKGDFKGKFNIEFKDNKHIELETGLTETPLSKETFDPHPYVNGYVNWVKKNTIYHKNFKLKTRNENFIVSGVIRFVIEPRCTLEEIPFTLVYENGELRIQEDMC